MTAGEFIEKNNIPRGVIVLVITFRGITSLEGIGQLVNLTTLHCNNNLLTDLKGIENLKNLTTLHCNNNQLTSLKDIEELTNLTLLDCDNNHLTSLNAIRDLKNLTYLFCADNQLPHEPNLKAFKEWYITENRKSKLELINNL